MPDGPEHLTGRQSPKPDRFFIKKAILVWVLAYSGSLDWQKLLYFYKFFQIFQALEENISVFISFETYNQSWFTH